MPMDGTERRQKYRVKLTTQLSCRMSSEKKTKIMSSSHDMIMGMLSIKMK